MHSVFETCVPRPEVLSGELREEIFAARLRDVIDGRADAVYQDSNVFFSQTYVTDGLRLLLSEALGRLRGTGGTNPIIRLETAFGGGKTHGLIALYHAAMSGLPASIAVNGDDDDAGVEDLALAGVVGTDLDPANGVRYTGITVHTLWGEIAYQLGGNRAYDLVRQSDENGVAPGTQAFDEIIGDRPALIMIDEIARHLSQASGMKVGASSDLAEQTIAFLMSLFEFAASRSRVLVVFTLAESTDAFAEETEELRQRLEHFLAEIKHISARQERVIRPSAETEMAAILTARLFQSVDFEAAAETAEEYINHFRVNSERNGDIPSRATRAEYQAEIESSYPFHPELLTVLNRKLSTIPSFQRTRGALRLLALSLRELWSAKPEAAYLIHPHHIPLGNEMVANDLTSRLDRPRYKQVIEADVASASQGNPAHAQRIDDETGSPLASQVGTTVFLHSLLQAGTIGVDLQDLTLAVTVPGQDSAIVRRSADKLVDRGWFIEFDQQRYRFKPEASLNKIVNDEAASISNVSVKNELEQRIKNIWKGGGFNVIYFPVEPANVPDDFRSPQLCILHFDAATSTAANAVPPTLAQNIMAHAGAGEAYRNYQNNVIFLVADADNVDAMTGRARAYLAMQRILNDTQRLAELPEEQRDRLRKMSGSTQLDVRVAITRAYRLLFFADHDAGGSSAHLKAYILQPQDQGTIQNDQSAVILRALKDNDKALTQDTPTQAAQAIKGRIWQHNATEMSTEDVLKAFARKLNMRIVFDVTQVKAMIENGVKTGVWVYYSETEGIGYDRRSPNPHIEISDNAKLVLPDAYAKSGRQIKGVVVAPPPDVEAPKAGSAGTAGAPPPKAPSKPQRFVGTGSARQAMISILDHCHDYQATGLRRFTVKFSGDKQTGISELRGLALAISQVIEHLPLIDMSFTAQFGGQEFGAQYRGSWERYRRLLKPAVDVLVSATDVDDFTADTALTYEFAEPIALNDEWLMRWGETLDDNAIGSVEIEANPVYEAAE